MSEDPPFVTTSTVKYIFILINEYSLPLIIAVLVIIAFVIFIEMIKHGSNTPRAPFKSIQRSSSNAMDTSFYANPPSIKPINHAISSNDPSIDDRALLSNNLSKQKDAIPPDNLRKQKAVIPSDKVRKEMVSNPSNKAKHVSSNPSNKPVIKPSVSSKIFYSSICDKNKKKAATNIIGSHRQSPTEHIERLQNELDVTYYPEYLDGYNALSGDEKKLLSAIKCGDVCLVKHIVNNNIGNIALNINFGECQVLRECVLSSKLSILKYLKSKFVDKLDLNGESGYILRWSSRKGLIDIINYLLFEQKYQNIDISYFQFQCIEWSIVYKHKEIAKILQKYYQNYKLSLQWNVLQHSQQDLGLEFDIFNLPSIYQQIIEMIVNSDQENTNKYVTEITKYYNNGCDLSFENNMPWTVSVDCKNIPILNFLNKRVNIDPLSSNNHLLRTALDLNCIQLLRFAKTIINKEQWNKALKALCHGNQLLIKELEEEEQRTPKKNNNKKDEIPQTPIPWPYEQPYVKQKYGILTRSKRKMLVKKGILQDPQF